MRGVHSRIERCASEAQRTLCANFMPSLMTPPYSIRHTLLLAFLLAGLLPAALVTGMAFFEARSALKTEIESDMQVRAAAAAEDIDHLMFERTQNVVSWSRLEIMQEARIGDVDKRLSNFLRDLKTSYHGIYTDLYVVDAKGVIIAASTPALLGKHPATTPPWLQAQLPDGRCQVFPLSNGALPLAASITDSLDNTPTGTLVALFDWSQITHVLEAASADTRAAALMDQHQTLTATTDWHEANGSSSRISAFSHEFKTFPAFGWHVVLTQPEAAAFAPIRHMGWIFLLLLALTALLASLAAAPVAARIAHPLAELTNFARNFMREQRAITPPNTGPAEVRELSAAFAQMIHDLERSRDNLTRAAKLAVVGEMAAAMTHEVRTPIGILRSSAQLLLREPGLSEEGREVCGFIVSETERLNRLVSTLLDCARPRQPEFKPLELAALIRQTATMLGSQAIKKHITIDCTNCTAVIAELDEEQITQVLLNLLLNALQILPEDGQISVATRQEGETAVLEVADNGPGISESLREQVFDPFFTRRSGGVGLGLAVVRQIVAAHQGEIGAFANPSGGALFRVRLPIQRKGLEVSP